MRIVFSGLVPLSAMMIASGLIALDPRGQSVWDHWDEVKRGILYRSGQLTGDQLREAVKRYQIRTVINLQWPGEEMKAERSLSRRLGVDFVNLPMPGDGLGEEWQFREILKILDDPARRPALVHCARGTCRTGAAVAFYRFERDRWTPEDVASELERQTYHYGLVPGYIYAMVKTKPLSSLLKADMVVDRNIEKEEPRIATHPQSDTWPAGETKTEKSFTAETAERTETKTEKRGERSD
jgi:protein tyrosine/serine phosphatase